MPLKNHPLGRAGRLADVRGLRAVHSGRTIEEDSDDVQFLASVLRNVASSRATQKLEQAAGAGRRRITAGRDDQLSNSRCLVALALAEINAAGGPKADAGVVFVTGARAMLAGLAAAADADPIGPGGTLLQYRWRVKPPAAAARAAHLPI